MEHKTGAEPVPGKPEQMNVGLRIAGAMLDYFIFSFGMFIALAPFMFLSLMSAISDQNPGNMFPLWLLPTTAVFYAIFLCKDVFNGRSPAKRIMKMQVVDLATGLPASALKCMLRNLTMIFWPLEAIAILVSPGRRVGDYLAGTEVVCASVPQRRPPMTAQILLAIFIALAISILITLPFYYLSQFVSGYQQQMMDEMYRY